MQNDQYLHAWYLTFRISTWHHWPNSTSPDLIPLLVNWLVVLGLTALWDSISVYIGPSPREWEKEKKSDRWEKNVQTSPTRAYCKRNRPLPTIIQISRTPRHWNVYPAPSHHRTTPLSHCTLSQRQRVSGLWFLYNVIEISVWDNFLCKIIYGRFGGGGSVSLSLVHQKKSRYFLL